MTALGATTDGTGGSGDPRPARLVSQLLLGTPAGSPEGVVERLLAVQAQDERGFRLAVPSRTSGLTTADVDDALTVRRSMVVTWLNRGTLHLVSSEDYWRLHPLTAPRMVTGNERRLRQEGVNKEQADKGVDTFVEAVTSDGPQTRRELHNRLRDGGTPPMVKPRSISWPRPALAGSLCEDQSSMESTHSSRSQTGWGRDLRRSSVTMPSAGLLVDTSPVMGLPRHEIWPSGPESLLTMRAKACT
jgi:hypothetical protein